MASTGGSTRTSRSSSTTARARWSGFWKQIALATRADGSRYEVAGIGGSWFGYAGDFQWGWQRDWFDYGNAAACFLEMMSDGTLSPGMTARMHRALGGGLPGHYPIGGAPAPMWPVTP